MATKNTDQDFIETVVKALVNNPSEVKTTRTVDEMGVLVTLKVNPEDMGIIIGRGGQNARAIRTLVRVVGAKNNAHVNLRIEEPEGREQKPAPSKAASKAAEASDDVDKAVEDLNL
ncbi:MAG: KH domain-containing protein [Candidatus Paceibacterota bacterium]|jgi:hypothetical protein